MARLAFAIGGQLIGSAIGGPIGGKIGFLAGAYLGGRLFGDSDAVEGPRMTDTSVQGSTYGTPIARHWGTADQAGTLLWVLGNKLIEVKRTESGKGFGPAYTSYEYFATFAVELCEGPITGVRRIKANTTLIYDIGSQDIAAQIAGGGGVTSNAQLPGVNIRIYTGTTTQKPDPTIEAEKGVGRTPGYRGRAYVVIENLPVEGFGNAIPLITCEVVANGTETGYEHVVAGTPSSFAKGDTLSRFSDNMWSTGLSTMWKADVSSGLLEKSKIFTGVLDFNGDQIKFGAGSCDDDDGFVYATGFGGIIHNPLYKFSGSALGLVEQFGSYSAGAVGHTLGLYVFSFRPFKRWLISKTLVNAIQIFDLDAFSDGAAAPSSAFGGAGGNVSQPFMREVFAGIHYEIGVVSNVSGTIDFTRLTLVPNDVPDGGLPWKTTRADLDITASVPGGGDGQSCLYYADDDSWIVHAGSSLVKIDAATDAILATLVVAGSTSSDQFWYGNGPQDGKTYLQATGIFYEIDLADLSISRQWTVSAFWSADQQHAIGFLSAEQAFVTFRNTGADRVYKLYLPRLDPLDVTVRSIIESISSDTPVNLPAARIDASLVAATTRGYTLRKAITGRAALESILGYYFIRGADIDTQMVFVPLGQAAEIVIDADDLGAGVGAPAATEGAILRTQEIELPRVLNVGFIDYEMEYDNNVQPYQRPREVVGSDEIINVDFAVVSNADEAAQVAEKMIFSRWHERKRVSVQLPRRYKQIAPLTVITVPLDGVNYDVRVETLTETQVLKIEGPVQRAATYASAAVGQSGQIPVSVIPVFADSLVFVLDVNALRDVDDGLGYYVGVAPKQSNKLWNGAQVHKSADGLSFDNLILTTGDKVTYGFADAALPDHTETIFDRTNSLDVQLITGALSSATEAAVLDLANHALLASGDNWEIIGFADAVDNGNGNYTLSTLLRGRRGTDDFSGGHVAGDRFILLDSAALALLETSNDLNLARAFKATTFGAFVDPNGAQWLTHGGRIIKPYSPALPAGSRDGPNNLTITWMRRSRFNFDGANFGPLPIGETSENYEVDILDAPGGNVLRTIVVTAETASYTAAEQSTDGLTPGDPVDIRLYQIGAVIGRGWPKAATV